MKRTRFNVGSVRAIVLTGATLAAIVPAAVLGIGSSLEIRSVMLNNQTELSEALARNLADEIDQLLRLRQTALVTLAASITTANTITDEAAVDAVATVRRNYDTFSRVSIIDPKGTVVHANPPIAPDGTPIAGTDVSDREYARVIMAEKRPVIMRNVTLSRLAKTPVLLMAVPILGKDNSLKGMVLATIDLIAEQAFAGAVRYGGNGHAVLADVGGKPIVHPDTAVVLAQTDFSKQPIWQHIGNTISGRIDNYRDENGRERIAGFATVPSSGWKIWLSQLRSDVDGEVSAVYLNVLFWVAIAFAIGLAAVLLLARMISRPIMEVSQAAGAVAAGAHDERAPVQGPREVRVLAEAVNDMAATLREKIETERAAKARLADAARRYSDHAARIAGGDLSARLETEMDEEFGTLGTSLNHMTEALARLVEEIGEAAGSLAGAAAEILAATSQQVASAAEESSAVRETSATVAEVRQSADASARTTRMVAELSQRVAATAEDGRKSVDESVRSSGHAKTRMEALAGRILAFSERAQAIAELNATVSDIAERSNLLAVNASIEAAKAGEAGRGFAVVAAEVKELAESCRQATTQVRGIVVEIQKSAQAAVIAAEQGVKAAEEGTGVAQRSGEAIASLHDSVGAASDAAQQIMASAEQQQNGMDQIALAMQNIERSSSQAVAATGQVERAARDLNQLAQKLASLIASVTPSNHEGQSVMAPLRAWRRAS